MAFIIKAFVARNIHLLPRKDEGKQFDGRVRSVSVTRLSDVEAAMLYMLIRRDKRYRDIQGVFLEKTVGRLCCVGKLMLSALYILLG